jgi:hypothetical protein
MLSNWGTYYHFYSCFFDVVWAYLNVNVCLPFFILSFVSFSLGIYLPLGFYFPTSVCLLSLYIILRPIFSDCPSSFSVAFATSAAFSRLWRVLKPRSSDFRRCPHLWSLALIPWFLSPCFKNSRRGMERHFFPLCVLVIGKRGPLFDIVNIALSFRITFFR